MAETTAGARQPRWWQRAVPVTALTVAALVAAFLLLPGAQEQLELSTSRKPQGFVELSLTGAPQEACRRTRLGFQVTSHLQRARSIRYAVTSAPRDEGRPARHVGRVRLQPGQSRSVWQGLPPRTGPATLTVALSDRPERLRVHCRGGVG